MLKLLSFICLPILVHGIIILPGQHSINAMAKVQSNTTWNLQKISRRQHEQQTTPYHNYNYRYVEGPEDVDVYLLDYGVDQSSLYFNHPIQEMNIPLSSPFPSFKKPDYSSIPHEDTSSMTQGTAIAGIYMSLHSIKLISSQKVL